MSRAGSSRGWNARKQESWIVNVLDAEERMMQSVDVDFKVAWLISKGVVAPEGKYTYAWAQKVLAQKSKAEMQLIALAALNDARESGNVTRACEVTAAMGPYITSKEPVAHEITGDDGGPISFADISEDERKRLKQAAKMVAMREIGGEEDE